MDDARALGRLLKSLRILAGRTQDEAAQIIGVSRQSVYMAERGTQPLAARTYVSLLAGLLADDPPARDDGWAPRPPS